MNADNYCHLYKNINKIACNCTTHVRKIKLTENQHWSWKQCCASTELTVPLGTEVNSSHRCVVEPLINTSALARLTISTWQISTLFSPLLSPPHFVSWEICARNKLSQSMLFLCSLVSFIDSGTLIEQVLINSSLVRWGEIISVTNPFKWLVINLPLYWHLFARKTRCVWLYQSISRGCALLGIFMGC